MRLYVEYKVEFRNLVQEFLMERSEYNIGFSKGNDLRAHTLLLLLLLYIHCLCACFVKKKKVIVCVKKYIYLVYYYLLKIML